MAGSIADFKASFSKDLARPNKFDVLIPVPYSMAKYSNDSRMLSFRCEATEIPGKTLSTTERKIGSTPNEKMPYHVSYNDITLTFIVDDDMAQRKFFDAWFELINPTSSYNFRYKSDYVVDMYINQYDNMNQVSYSALLKDAFPISMNQLDLDWSTDGHHKLSIVFAYTEVIVPQSGSLLSNVMSDARLALSDEINKLIR